MSLKLASIFDINCIDGIINKENTIVINRFLFFELIKLIFFSENVLYILLNKKTSMQRYIIKIIIIAITSLNSGNKTGNFSFKII
ncbi:hypothetical protein GW820_03420 [archaeon]|nr:hypothetical protein [archaeon]NCT58148.1 hypothetical protein [archaeon]